MTTIETGKSASELRLISIMTTMFADVVLRMGQVHHIKLVRISPLGLTATYSFAF